MALLLHFEIQAVALAAETPDPQLTKPSVLRLVCGDWKAYGKSNGSQWNARLPLKTSLELCEIETVANDGSEKVQSSDLYRAPASNVCL
jgi:hypothetical protein